MYDLRDEHRRDPFEEDPHCCALEHVTRKKIDGPDGYLEQEISNELHSAGRVQWVMDYANQL